MVPPSTPILLGWRSTAREAGVGGEGAVTAKQWGVVCDLSRLTGQSPYSHPLLPAWWCD